MMIRIRSLIFRDLKKSQKLFSSGANPRSHIDLALKCDDIDELIHLLYGNDNRVFSSDEQRNIIDLVAKKEGMGFSHDGKCFYLNSCPEDFCEIKNLPNDAQEYMKELFEINKIKPKH